MRAGDARRLAALYRDNREHLALFEPVRDEKFLTNAGQAARLDDLTECVGRHGLHRLEAGTPVDNLATQAVLRRNGR